MKYDITALGEVLIDFVPAGKDEDGDLRFARKAGGAPMNLLATATKYGASTAMISRVGRDIFGSYLLDTLSSLNIDTSGVIVDEIHNTTLAFVELKDSGDRDFSFYRRFGADVNIELDDAVLDIIRNSKIFHFGSLSLTAEPARSSVKLALDTATDAGCIISYDPNYRAPLWDKEQTAVKYMRMYLDKVDIIKVSKEELLMISGLDDENEAIRFFMSKGIRIVLVTDGKYGAAVYFGNDMKKLPAYDAKTIDTTGAGDIFFGTFLSEFIKSGKDLNALSFDEIFAFFDKAMRASAKSTEKHGAIASIPDTV